MEGQKFKQKSKSTQTSFYLPSDIYRYCKQQQQQQNQGIGSTTVLYLKRKMKEKGWQNLTKRQPKI